VATEESLRLRTTLILLVVAGAIAAYAYFVERPARQRESEEQTLLTFDRDAVVELTLTYPEREIRLTKGPDAHWRIAAPIEVDADQSVVNNLVGAIAGAALTRTISEPSEDVSAYGLDKPVVTISLRLGDGTATPALIVGKQTPIGFKAYVQKEGDPNVYLTTGSFHSGVKREVKDLRDKTVIEFTDDQVQTITLAGDARGAVVLRKTDGIWRITDPAEYAADAGEVRTFLSSLRGLRAQDFIEEPPDDLTMYGLAAPRLRVTLSIGEEGTPKSVLLGAEAPGTPKRIYAKRGERDTIYLLGDWVFKNLDKDTTGFRDRTVLAFERDAPVEITITGRDRDPVRLERVPGGPWALKGINETPRQPKIDRFVDDLRQTKPADIVSEDVTDFPRYGLDDPDLSISVVAENGHLIGTLLATRHRGEDAEDEFYFAREGMPTIFKGSRYMLTNLDKKPSDFLEPAEEDSDNSAAEEGLEDSEAEEDLDDTVDEEDLGDPAGEEHLNDLAGEKSQ